jgi:hypothetical protein
MELSGSGCDRELRRHGEDLRFWRLQRLESRARVERASHEAECHCPTQQPDRTMGHYVCYLSHLDWDFVISVLILTQITSPMAAVPQRQHPALLHRQHEPLCRCVYRQGTTVGSARWRRYHRCPCGSQIPSYNGLDSCGYGIRKAVFVDVGTHLLYNVLGYCRLWSS